MRFAHSVLTNAYSTCRPFPLEVQAQRLNFWVLTPDSILVRDRGKLAMSATKRIDQRDVRDIIGYAKVVLVDLVERFFVIEKSLRIVKETSLALLLYPSISPTEENFRGCTPHIQPPKLFVSKNNLWDNEPPYAWRSPRPSVLMAMPMVRTPPCAIL